MISLVWLRPLSTGALTPTSGKFLNASRFRLKTWNPERVKASIMEVAAGSCGQRVIGPLYNQRSLPVVLAIEPTKPKRRSFRFGWLRGLLRQLTGTRRPEGLPPQWSPKQNSGYGRTSGRLLRKTFGWQFRVTLEPNQHVLCAAFEDLSWYRSSGCWKTLTDG